MAAATTRAGAYQWAELMRRTFGVDVLACPRCGGRPRLVALIDQATVIQQISRHLGLPTDAPEPHPARPPPCAVTRSRISRRMLDPTFGLDQEAERTVKKWRFRPDTNRLGPAVPVLVEIEMTFTLR
jgi:hypothetical protein